MKVEFDIPDELAIEMKNHTSVNWSNIISQTVEGFLHDLTILDKLKEFWGIQQTADKAASAQQSKKPKKK